MPTIKKAAPKPDVTMYHFDPQTNEAIGSDVADLDPLENKPLLPAFATLIAPPATIAAGKVAVFDEATNKWSEVEDHRGKVYDTATGDESLHDKLGILPAALTTTAPTPNGSWNAVKKAWVLDAAKAAAESASVINVACAADIVGGFSSSALGIAHTYDSAMEDQLNLIGAAGANIDLLYTCTDAAGVKDAVLHTAAQLKQVYADGVAHKTTQLSKARALKVQLDALAANAATTQTDIDAVIW